MLGARGGAVRDESGKSAELQRRGPDAAGGAVDEHALSRLQLREAVQHLPGRNVVENQADRFSGIKANGDRSQFANRKVDELRVSTPLGESGDRLPDAKAGDAVAEFHQVGWILAVHQPSGQ